MPARLAPPATALVAATATALALALVGAARADGGGRPLTTALSGAEVVGPDGALGRGDPDGTGFAGLRLNPGQEELCYELAVATTEPATLAHLRIGPAGANGPIAIHLAPPHASGASAGCVAAPRELLRAIGRDPGNYYVQVPTADFPGGAVRGQLGD